MEFNLSSEVLFVVVVIYFLVLLTISWFTGRENDNENFFNARRSSPWYLVAIGMIGATLSGVTFISVPGVVGQEGINTNYSYMQMVFGYLLGYVVIANVLLPIYYRYQLTSIYSFLEERLGWGSYKTASGFFILSRIIGASFRLFLVAMVLQIMIMDAWNIPFWLTVILTVALIWIYTFRGGIKTIVVTDTLQTFFMLTAVLATIYSICSALDISVFDIWPTIKDANLGQWFYFENGWSDPNNFFKQFLNGALITIVMTGLDQDMMQKNLTCRSISDAKKNMYVFSGILVLANLLFITLGALLYIYSAEMAIELPEKVDRIFPTLAMSHLPSYISILFLIGILAAAYSSADSALTSLTTAFCIDFLNFEKQKKQNDKSTRQIRFLVHLAFSIILVSIVVLFEQLNSKDAILNDLFRAAGYTYGPILALFCFALWVRKSIPSIPAILVCIISPVAAFWIDEYSSDIFNGFEFGFLILLLNALITFIGLHAILIFNKKGSN